MGDTSEEKQSFSILEKFRQLAKEKEQERSETKKSKPNETIDAVYFRNANTSNDRRRGHFSRRGNFRGKRKFDGEHSSLPDWKVRRMQERHKIGPHVGPREQNVGITEYISSLPGFNGIIKQRFTDFQLNEISEDGTICKLTSQDIPQNPAETADDSAIDDAELLKILPKEKWDKLYSIVANEDPEDSVDIDVTNISKDDRVTIHNAIKSLYKDKVISNTIDKNEKKILQISYSTDQQERRAKRRSMWKNRGFLYFLLHKENMDTMEAVNLLAHKLLKRGNQIMFCGTKDKRAVSTQLMCVKKVTAERLHKIQPLRNVVLGNYEYKSSQLKLGQLKGNRFRIAVRNVDATDEAISETIESLKTKGFLNYYGMQRFGSSLIVPTHVIGLALIRRDWKEAVDLILKPRAGERCFAETAEARMVWSETRDAKKALKCFHWKNTSIEAKLLQGLDKNGPTAYLNALENLTRNLTMFYCHAYQSLIWNKVISRRVKEFGLTVLPGDIILLDNNNVEEEEEFSKKDNVKNGNENEDSDLDETDNKEDDSQIRDEFVNEKPKAFINVKILNEEEAKEANIEDIVYPLPGYDITYPNNVTASWYKEFLAEDNLSDASLLECKPYAHIYPMYGTYRKILHKPTNVSWSVIKYSEENCDLLLTDLDIMNDVAPPKDCPDGKYKALLLQFDLGACTYATMALREIMKCETSSGYQATLSAQHQPDNVPDAEPQVDAVEVVKSESVPNNCTEVNEEKSNVL